MLVCVFPNEYLLHVLELCDGLQMLDWSSRLVRLEPIVECGYTLGRERCLFVHFPVFNLTASAVRPREKLIDSEPALLTILGVRLNLLVPNTDKLLCDACCNLGCSAAAPKSGSRSLRIPL